MQQSSDPKARGGAVEERLRRQHFWAAAALPAPRPCWAPAAGTRLRTLTQVVDASLLARPGEPPGARKYYRPPDDLTPKVAGSKHARTGFLEPFEMC